MAITDFTVTRGNLFEQVEMVYDDLVSLILRIYKVGSERLQEQIEIEWTVGEYPLGDYEGRNMVIRYTTDQGSTDRQSWSEFFKNLMVLVSEIFCKYLVLGFFSLSGPGPTWSWISNFRFGPWIPATDIENVSPAGYPTGTKLETDSSGRGWIQRYTGMGLPSLRRPTGWPSGKPCDRLSSKYS